MSKTVIDLQGSKQLLGSLFELEIGKIVETIRRESADDKDALILKLESKIKFLSEENAKYKYAIEQLKNYTSHLKV